MPRATYEFDRACEPIATLLERAAAGEENFIFQRWRPARAARATVDAPPRHREALEYFGRSAPRTRDRRGTRDLRGEPYRRLRRLPTRTSRITRFVAPHCGSTLPW